MKAVPSAMALTASGAPSTEVSLMSRPDPWIAARAPIAPPSLTEKMPARFGCDWIMFSTTPSATERSWRPFWVSTSVIPSLSVFARLIARVAVLRPHEGIHRAAGVGVHRHHDHALVLGHAHGRFHARAVGRVQQQDVDALLQHILHVRDLLGHVMARVGDDHLGPDLGGGLVQGLLHGHEIRVVHFLERHADLQRVVLCRGQVGRGGKKGRGGCGLQQGLHGSSSR